MPIEESNRTAKSRRHVRDPAAEAPTIERSTSLGFVPTLLPSLRRDDPRRTTPHRGVERVLDSPNSDDVGDEGLAFEKTTANSSGTYEKFTSFPVEMAKPAPPAPRAEVNTQAVANAPADGSRFPAFLSRSEDGRHDTKAVQSNLEAGTDLLAAQSGSMVHVEGRLAAGERSRGESSLEPQGAYDRKTAHEIVLGERHADPQRKRDDTAGNDPTNAGFGRPTADDDTFTINVSIGRIDVAPPAFPSTPPQTVRAEPSRPSLDDYMHERAKIRGR